VLKNGQVQKFEFTTELLWKMLKAFLLEWHGIDAASPKEVIRRYFDSILAQIFEKRPWGK